jgi:hypothetical protein
MASLSGFSWSHSDTPHSPGSLRTSDHTDAENSTCEHTTRTRDRRDPNPQSQQASGSRPTPHNAWLLGPSFLLNFISYIRSYVTENTDLSISMTRVKFMQWNNRCLAQKSSETYTYRVWKKLYFSECYSRCCVLLPLGFKLFTHSITGFKNVTSFTINLCPVLC